ncbi:LD-carboxypeptidase [Paenibacillus sp. J2TS4]|uniref:S66 peptidase family protein n=1 Tax=Paenibacillus sp. J2TS4 TaxID=2807194 RepID=UPI001B065F47|nr:LD-carboxypeptidase [Paenibacillus sp. J2TS4]GIP34064.1 putative murein peptide carboxypeptidase [Paenibacillus sp. J2TS4]
MSNRIIPKALQYGDCIAITAPASYGEIDTAKAVKRLESLGLRVKLGETLHKQYGYLAGTDQERADELNSMFADSSVQGILCARGGYGTARMADLLDYELIAANPKPFWGYSDITFLHTAIGMKSGLVTYHGPMLICLAKENLHPHTWQSMEQLVKSVPLNYTEELSPLHVLVEGEASGPIIGGNLSLITSSIGTPYEMDTRDCLLLLEDVQEEPYRVDRMLNQLKMAGKLREAAGFIIGDFTDCDSNKHTNGLSLQQVLEHYLVPIGKPALSGFRIGHGDVNIAVPLGVPSLLNTAEKSLKQLV